MKFQVADVKPASGPSRYTTVAKNQLEFLANSRREGAIEAWSKPSQTLISSGISNQFVAAVEIAFANHYPLVLSPDSLWITLTQGLAKHIDKNSEALRKHFVAHDGKATITVQRNSFVKGSPDNDWPGAFSKFSAAIKEHIGKDNHKAIIADFSTTGPIELAASEVVLMDAMKHYFEYRVMTCCGIPEITLLGKVEDWESIRDKINSWSNLGLDWWTPHLKIVLDRFIDAAKGKVDKSWWESIYKEHGGMGSGATTQISGWINWIFPYLATGNKNPYVGKVEFDRGDGLAESDYPNSLSKAPFIWDYYGQEFKYEFLAGLTSVAQDQNTLSVTPLAGWGVRPESAVSGKSSMGTPSWEL